MAEIRLLDKHMAELIAAGEVVERPASVVKELTENAIDAGATNITVSIAHGGITMIQISDNGSGIESEFVATAFLRHATSKIQTQEDLDSIHTLGFRGEALASIASVAKVELLTKTQQDEFACCYRINGGEEEGLEAAARPVGTTITVRDLFYNTPARMKFLKKDGTEGSYVADVVGRLALSHPEISFKFLRDGKVQFQTPGDGNLMGAAYAVLSRDFAKDLVEVNATEGNYRVQGLVTPPKSGRASRSMQFFFINGRFVKSPKMMAALENAYRGIMMQGRFPGCVLMLTMPPELVDVNVHPAKTEVRFARDNDVFNAIYSAVKCVLLTPENTEKEIVFAQDAKPTPSPKSWERPVSAPKEQIENYQSMLNTLASEPVIPYKTKPVSVHDIPKVNVSLSAEQELPIVTTPAIEKSEIIEQTALYKTEEAPLRFIGEVFDTYIITQRDDEICFIDKHAAHERLIYEKIMETYGNIASQMLLTPITVLLSGEEKSTLLQNEKMLADSGIELEDFGGNSIIVRAVPADVVPDDIENLMVEMASHLCENPRYTTDEKTQWVLHSISCRAAMKGGDKTTAIQLMALAQQVLEGHIPPFCPHGRPIVLKMTEKELEKQFGRQG